MNFGVMGEPCIDYIYRDNKEMQEKLGGILYAITGLSLIAGNDHNVYPIMNLGEDKYDYIVSFLQTLKNIKLDFVNKVQGKVRVVKLFYKSRNEKIQENNNTLPSNKRTYDREECSTEPIKAIEFELIKDALNKLDGLYINMVSGIDITLDTLKKIHSSFSGYIHLDVHNIVMRTGSDGNRNQGPVQEWFEWLTCSNTFQMNETEASVITPERLKEYEIAFKVLKTDKTGPGAMIITRGPEGISLFAKKIKSTGKEKYYDIDRIDEPAIENDKFIDSTGCGDVFGAGFFYKNLLNNMTDFIPSMNYANKLASKKTGYTGVEDFANMFKDIIIK